MRKITRFSFVTCAASAMQRFSIPRRRTGVALSACMLVAITEFGQESNAAGAANAPSAANRIQPVAHGEFTVEERSAEAIASFPVSSIPAPRTAPFRPTDMSEATYQAMKAAAAAA